MARFLSILCAAALLAGCGSGERDAKTPATETIPEAAPPPKPEALPVAVEPEPIQYPTGPVPDTGIHEAAANGDIETVRQAIVTSLGNALGNPVLVEAHGGRFGRAELARYSKRAPVVLIAAMSLPSVGERGSMTLPTVQFAAFVICRDAPGEPRDTQALTLAEALVRHITGNRWEQESVQRPERINAENLYSGEIDRLGIAMWAVSWSSKSVSRQPFLSSRSTTDPASFGSRVTRPSKARDTSCEPRPSGYWRVSTPSPAATSTPCTRRRGTRDFRPTMRVTD